MSVPGSQSVSVCRPYRPWPAASGLCRRGGRLCFGNFCVIFGFCTTYKRPESSSYKNAGDACVAPTRLVFGRFLFFLPQKRDVARNKANFGIWLAGGWGSCAKQSQFPAPPGGMGSRDKGRGDSSLAPPACGLSRGRLCKTKPSNMSTEKQSQLRPARRNRWGQPCPQTRSFAFGSPIHPTSGRNCAKRTQCAWAWREGARAGQTGEGATTGRESCETKPNLGGLGYLGPRARSFVQTNPIPALMPIRRSAVPGGQIVRNKANSRRRRVGQGLGDDGRLCKTKPISQSRPGRPWYWDPKRDRSRLGRAPTGETEPVGTRTHSWARRPCYGMPCGVTTNRASAPNKPNFGESEREPRGAIVQNKANVRRAPSNGRGAASRPSRCRRARACETNPISGGQGFPLFHHSSIPVPSLRAKQDARDKSRRIGFRSAFLGEYQGSVRLIPTFVGRVKQSQFARRTGKRRRRPGRGQTKPISTYRVDPMDPEHVIASGARQSAAVRRLQPEVACLLCGVEFSAPWGYDLWDASRLPSSRRKEGLCFLTGPGKGWIQAVTWTIDGQQQSRERGGPGRPRQQ